MYQRINIPKEQSKYQLKKYLNYILERIPYNIIQKWFRLKLIKNKNGKFLNKNIILNKEKFILIPQTNQLINNYKKIFFYSLKNIKFLTYKFQKSILKKNNHFVIISKDQGIPTQTGIKHQISINNLANAWSKQYKQNKPLLVHRLDNKTSGILLMASNYLSANNLAIQFQKQNTQKEYWAIVHNIPKKTSGIIKLKLKKYIINKQQNIINNTIDLKAITYYKIIISIPKFNIALLSLYPKTGRKHQIRIHCSYSGFPIIGDNKYGENIFLKKQLHLHKYSLFFKDYKGENQNYYISIPKYMLETLIESGLKTQNIINKIYK